MTVSPTGAQRPAERTFGAEETADDPGIAADVTLLPPTLLRLPDLDRPGPTETPERSAASEQISGDDFRAIPPSSGQSSPTEVSWGRKQPELAPIDQKASPQTAPSPTDDPEPTADGLLPDPSRAATEIPAEAGRETASDVPKRTPHRHDAVPEGRGWMERIGSRSIALLVLLSLVATAIVAGRNSDPHPRFDDESARELSITPELPQSPEARIAIKPAVDQQVAAADEKPETVTPSEPDNLSPASGPSGPGEHMTAKRSTADRDVVQPARPSTEPVWDVDPHAVWNTPENAVGSPESTTGDPESKASDPGADNSDGGDAGSPGSAAGPVIFSDELSWDAPQVSPITPDAKPRRGPRYSDTPEPITNWRRYLPDPETDYIAAPPQLDRRR